MSPSNKMKFGTYEAAAEFAEKKIVTEENSMSRARTVAIGERQRVNPIDPGLRYYSVEFRCSKGGNRPSRSTGQRKRQSEKTNCPVLIKLRATKDGKSLQVVESVIGHQHCPCTPNKPLPKKKTALKTVTRGKNSKTGESHQLNKSKKRINLDSEVEENEDTDIQTDPVDPSPSTSKTEECHQHDETNEEINFNSEVERNEATDMQIDHVDTPPKIKNSTPKIKNSTPKILLREIKSVIKTSDILAAEVEILDDFDLSEILLEIGDSTMQVMNDQLENAEKEISDRVESMSISDDKPEEEVAAVFPREIVVAETSEEKTIPEEASRLEINKPPLVEENAGSSKESQLQSSMPLIVPLGHQAAKQEIERSNKNLGEEVSVSDLKLVARRNTKGRPKGAVLKPIGLPKKSLPASFKGKNTQQKKKQMLEWLFPLETVELILTREHDISIEEIPADETSIPDSFLDTNVSINKIEVYFTSEAFAKFSTLVDKKRDGQKYHCNICKKLITSKQSSVGCDRCLCWYHMKCATEKGASELPRGKKLWYCQACQVFV